MYDIEYKIEKDFVKLCYINELEIRFNLIKETSDYFYLYNNDIYFVVYKEYVTHRTIFYINEKILFLLKSKYVIDKNDYEKIMTNIVKKYFIYSDVDDFTESYAKHRIEHLI